jgi:DNA-binding MarR family transcriptional regulator
MTADAPYSKVELELALLLRRARAHYGDVARDVHPDLRATAYALLGRLLDTGGSRASELCDYFGLDKGAISRQLQLLEEIGLVARTVDPLDGRANLVALTEVGAHRLNAAREGRRAIMRQQLARWPEQDIVVFADLLERFNALPIDHPEL